MEKAFGPVIIGEWILATDNCAMWLNGFNDNSPGYPKLPCKFIECAEPYMGTDQPGRFMNSYFNPISFMTVPLNIGILCIASSET